MTAANVQIVPNSDARLPTKLDDNGAASGRSQRDRRYTVTVRDQHRHPTARGGRFAAGRSWWGEVERAANRDMLINGRPIPDAFVGQITPGAYVTDDAGRVDRGESFSSVWDAPFLPLPKYHVFNYARQTLSFNYTKMKLDETDMRRKYWIAAGKLGVQLNLPVDPRKPPHAQIILALGEPSELYRVADACIAGDPWVLGYIDEPNLELQRILNIHPLAGFSFDEIPPSRAAQDEKVEAVISAAPSQDLLEMIAAMQAKIASLEAAAEPKRTTKARD